MAVKFIALTKIAGYLLCATFSIIASTTPNFGTWNVCGLSTTQRQHLVVEDTDRYDLEILAFQEIKTHEFFETTLPGHHRLFLFDQKQGKHGSFCYQAFYGQCFIPSSYSSDQ